MWYGFASCSLGLCWEEGVKEREEGRTGTLGPLGTQGRGEASFSLAHLLPLAGVVSC